MVVTKMFIGLLASVLNASNHTKCISLSNQQCMIEPTLINLHPNGYSQGLRYYPFVVNLDRCVGSCNTLYDLSNKVCVPRKTEDLNVSVFNMITRIRGSKYVSCKYKCNFDGTKCNLNQKWNNNKCQRECKNLQEYNLCEKDYIWNPAPCSCENS